MGFWNAFFSDNKCPKCGSYDTTELDFSPDNYRYFTEKMRDQISDYIADGRLPSDVDPKVFFKCNKCGTETMRLHSDSRRATWPVMWS